MAKTPNLNRREFIQGGTAGLAALAGMSMAGSSNPGKRPNYGSASKGSDAVLERRKRYLETLQKILPRTTTNELTGRMNGGDKNWEAWVARTGELPPDFESMPSNNFLPDPLVRLEGTRSTPITTLEQWAQQRQWIRSEFEHWVYGKMPPPPDNLRAVVTETRREGGVTVREVRLEFGPDHRGILHVHLFIPDGKGPFPVFLTNQPETAQLDSPRDSPRLYRVCV